MDPESDRGLRDRRPIPDPTILTTQQLFREIAALEKILITRIEGVKSEITVRLDAMDKAMEVATDIVTHTPTEIDREITHLKALHDSKFNAIDRQFENRDSRLEQANRDNKENVQSALKAANDSVSQHNQSSALAIAKSEAAFAKQIDQQAVVIQTMKDALESKMAASNESTEDKISELRKSVNSTDSRVTQIEGRGSGVTSAEHKQESSNNWIATVIGLIIGVGGVGIAALAIITK
jgi:hypothetical protein